jgi:hypothetical protein
MSTTLGENVAHFDGLLYVIGKCPFSIRGRDVARGGGGVGEAVWDVPEAELLCARADGG